MLREAGVAEVDEADGREGVHQLLRCPLDVTFVQLGVVRGWQWQRRKIYHWNRRHLLLDMLVCCVSASYITVMYAIIKSAKDVICFTRRLSVRLFVCLFENLTIDVSVSCYVYDLFPSRPSSFLILKLTTRWVKKTRFTENRKWNQKHMQQCNTVNKHGSYRRITVYESIQPRGV